MLSLVHSIDNQLVILNKKHILKISLIKLKILIMEIYVIGDSNKGNLYSKGNNKGNHMAQWNLFDAVNNVILKFSADDL